MTTPTRGSAQHVINSIRPALSDTLVIVQTISDMEGHPTYEDVMQLVDTLRILEEVVNYAETAIPREAISDQAKAVALGQRVVL